MTGTAPILDPVLGPAQPPTTSENYENDSSKTPRSPKFLGILPIKQGGHIIMGVMLIRGIIYLLTGITRGHFFIETTHAMNVLCCILGVLDIIFALMGHAGIIRDSVTLLQYHFAYRISAAVLFAPYMTGYLLFETSMMKHLPLFVGVIIIVLGILLEAILLVQMYKLLLFEMRVQQFMAGIEFFYTHFESRK